MTTKLATIILCLLCTTSSLAADRLSVSFSQTPLPMALKTIEQLAGDEITVNFSFRKLEDYTVTTEIIDATPLEAINQAVGFYPIKVTDRGGMITVQPLLDSKHKISGRLVDENGNGVDFASIVILSLPDSSFITSGVSNLRGDFVLPVPTNSDMVLKATRIGYKQTLVRAYASNMGVVRIETDPLMLKTLTAFADKRIINNVGSVTNILIEGTPYSSIGSLTDLLPNLPGFGQASSAFGAYANGGIVYYINGRQVADATQLNMLRSDEVKSISIDKAPGAEYPADAVAVVNISTIKSPEDFINFRINNNMQARSKLSDMPSADLKLQFGKFTTAFNYRYDYLLSETLDYYDRWINNDGIYSTITQERTFSNKDKGSRLNWSGEVQFNPRNRLGLYYYYYSIEQEVSGNGFYTAAPSNEPNGRIDINSIRHGHSSLHSGTLSYDYTGKIFNAHIAQDLAYTNPSSSVHTAESGKEATNRYDLHDHEYTVSTTNARFGLNLPCGTVINGGGRLSYIESDTGKTFIDNDGYWVDDDGSFGRYNKYNRMCVTETTAEAFVTMSQRIGNLIVMPGLRYQHVERQIDDISTVNDPAAEDFKPTKEEYTYDRSFSHFLPSLLMKYANGNFNTVLNYGRRMVQPTFSMLNSGLVYEDNYNYFKSNPELKPTQIDEVRLSAGYRGFNADFGFKSMKNPIVEVELPVGKTAIVYRTPINMRRYNEYDFNLSYSSSWHRLGYYASAGIVIPGWHTVEYSNQKVTFNAEINLTYKINDEFSVYTNFKHYSSCRWMVYDRIDSQIWNFGISSSINNRITINIEGTDLLNRNNLYHITTVYGGVENRRFGFADNLGVNVRISYTLFNKPIRTNVKRGNVDDINRIER